jgi:hypothetical protein
VLHHARQLSRFCAEACRVLRDGGMLLAIREHVITRAKDLDAFLAGHPLHRLYGGENAYVLEDYECAIRSAGIRLTQVLNPAASDVNLFPDTQHAMKSRLAAKVHLPWPGLIPNALLRLIGASSRVPGRHYSFVGIKTGHG